MQAIIYGNDETIFRELRDVDEERRRAFFSEYCAHAQFPNSEDVAGALYRAHNLPGPRRRKLSEKERAAARGYWDAHTVALKPFNPEIPEINNYKSWEAAKENAVNIAWQAEMDARRYNHDKLMWLGWAASNDADRKFVAAPYIFWESVKNLHELLRNNPFAPLMDIYELGVLIGGDYEKGRGLCIRRLTRGNVVVSDGVLVE
jgi:hypothetical protein